MGKLIFPTGVGEGRTPPKMAGEFMADKTPNSKSTAGCGIQILEQKGDADARLRFCMSPDGMKLGISRYFKPSCTGKPLTAESIMQQVRNAGIQVEPDAEAAASAVELLQKNQDVSRVVLARGIPPVDASDASLDPIGDHRFPVFAGQAVCKKTMARASRVGKALDGSPIPPAKKGEKGKNLKIKMGENLEMDGESGVMRATCYGRVIMEKDRVDVLPLLKITKDTISVVGTLHYRDAHGKPVTAERLEPELKEMGVALPVLRRRVEYAVEQAKKTGEAQPNSLIVKGKEPKHGRDGWYEYLTGTKVDVGVESESGRVDFRDRGQFPSAKAGELVIKIHLPEPGEGGIDVYGKTIPAKTGRELHLKPGEGVEMLPDEVTFRATENGLVVVEYGEVKVTDVLEIRGDVDISTGNIRADKGSIRIQGSIQSGLVVQSPGPIIVGQTVESATLTAGSDIEIGGGVLMADKGLIKAARNVSIGFGSSAIIEAGGDVYIKNEATNCTIHAGGWVYAKEGKGIILGGTITCGRGLEANEIGSEMGVDTTIILSLGGEDLRVKHERRMRLKEEIDKIDSSLGTTIIEEIARKTPPAKRQVVARVLSYRRKQLDKFIVLTRDIARENRRRKELMSVLKVRVHRRIYPGTLIKFAGRILKIDETVERAVIYWDTDTRNVEIGSF